MKSHLIHAKALCCSKARQNAEYSFVCLNVWSQFIAIYKNQAWHLLLGLCSSKNNFRNTGLTTKGDEEMKTGIVQSCMLVRATLFSPALGRQPGGAAHGLERDSHVTPNNEGDLDL